MSMEVHQQVKNVHNYEVSFRLSSDTKTNLWVGVEEIGRLKGAWNGNFAIEDWWDGQFPAASVPGSTFRAAYLDKDANFKLRASDRSFKAGVICITYAVGAPPE